MNGQPACGAGERVAILGPSDSGKTTLLLLRSLTQTPVRSWVATIIFASLVAVLVLLSLTQFWRAITASLTSSFKGA